MDLEAILERKPTVVLVDEFAHTNSPGSKNQKRYEDVLELLDAGISVITTLNVQHLESLYNMIEVATGIKVKERIPDSIVAQADQIINIDLPAEDLIERLKAGKIYPLDRVERAMGNFFTESNLTRLREITFSEVANFLDRRQRLLKPDSNKPSSMAKVMVAISSRGPHPETLLRKTARLANQLNAQWYVVYVRTNKEAPDRIPGGNPSPPHRYFGDCAKNGRHRPGFEEQRCRYRRPDLLCPRIMASPRWSWESLSPARAGKDFLPRWWIAQRQPRRRRYYFILKSRSRRWKSTGRGRWRGSMRCMPTPSSFPPASRAASSKSSWALRRNIPCAPSKCRSNFRPDCWKNFAARASRLPSRRSRSFRSAHAKRKRKSPHCKPRSAWPRPACGAASTF
jgi:hypothetical protein